MDMPTEGWDWIARCDGPFKHALDRTKYATRYPDEDPETHRAEAMVFLSELNNKLDMWVFEQPTLADMALLPFVRQFAFIDKEDFDRQDILKVQNWLQRFLESAQFASIMTKYPQWVDGDVEPIFPLGGG